jgi:hypothetical protein
MCLVIEAIFLFWVRWILGARCFDGAVGVIVMRGILLGGGRKWCSLSGMIGVEVWLYRVCGYLPNS